MGQVLIQSEQEKRPSQKSYAYRQPCHVAKALCFGHADGGVQQTPKTRSEHHAASESHQNIHKSAFEVFHEKYHRRAQGSHKPSER